MRVVVVGATGNVGTSLLRALTDEPRVRSVVGIARRLPAMAWPETEWIAAEIRRYFAGPLLPGVLLRRGLIPVVPDVRGLRFQAVHSLDVGDAYRRAIVGDVRGAFNIAAEPVLDPDELADLLGARKLPLP